MNTTKTIALSLLAIVSSALSTQAQTTAAAAATPSGVLGQRFSEVSFGASNIKGISRDLYDLSLNGNVPVAANLDLGLSYSYSWIGGAFKGHANTLGATATTFTSLNGVKPFVGVGLGYQWESFPFGSGNNAGIWGVGFGVEIPAGAFSITPNISYADDFRSSGNSSQQYTYGVDANYWLNQSSAISAGVSFTDARGNAEAWNYRIGYRWKF